MERWILPVLALAAPLAQAQVDFAPAADFQLSGAGPRDIVAARLDADSALDLAVTSAQGDGKLTVLLNDGAGDFSDDQPLTVGWSAWGIASGDLDGDGINDLVATDGNAASNAVYLFRGDGNGGFSALGSPLSAGAFPTAVVVGRFDGDSHTDMAVASGQAGITVFPGTGNGNFGSPTSVPNANLALQDLAIAFLDGNTVPDLLTPQAAFLGDGQGGFVRGASFGGTMAVASGRVDSDGVTDVVAITDSQIQLWLGNGDGSFRFGSLHTPGGTLSAVAVADLDNDQHADVVVSDSANDRVAVLLGGNGGLAAPQYFATGSQPAAVVIGDWNDDQRPDLAVPYRNLGEMARLSILLQSPSQDTALIFRDGFE